MNKNESNMNIQQVTSLSRMKNKTIAIYGIAEIGGHLPYFILN
jgi:hypothetical protein